MTQPKLKAGAGSSEIRFPAGMLPTDGFCGVHDFPHTRILLIECGECIVLVSLELVSVPDNCLETIRRYISEQTGAQYENVWVHVTHAITTPHAPKDPNAPSDRPGPPKGKPARKEDPDGARKLQLYVDALRVSVEQALEQAKADLADAVFGIGTGLCDVNVNRDVETPFGYWVGKNPEGPSNKTAAVLRFDRPNGGPAALVINYGLKPCCIDNSEMEKGTRLISSDVPGYVCMKLEEKYGAPVLFTMSAAGDQVPVEQAWYDEVGPDGAVRKVDLGVEKGLEAVARLGERMAAQMSAIADCVSCGQDTLRIDCGREAFRWPTKKRQPMKPTRSISYESDGEREMDAHVFAMGNTALVAVKPEVNTVTEAQLKQMSPYENTLLISMVNGGMKYMPERSAYDRVTWEALNSGLMPGAAEAWVEKAAELLNQMHSAQAD